MSLCCTGAVRQAVHCQHAIRVQAVYKLSRVYMPLCVHWWDLFYLFFAAMIRKPSPIIRLLHPQAAQIWMFDMYEHSFLSHRSPTEWELNSGSITFSHKWTVTPHSMYTHRHVNPHMPRFWGKNALRKKKKLFFFYFMLANKKKTNFMGNLIKGKKEKEKKKLERFPPSLFN